MRGYRDGRRRVALIAELAAARWTSTDDLSAQLPLARCDGARALVPIGSTHFVELIVRYDIGMILVAFAGPNAAKGQAETKRGRTAA